MSLSATRHAPLALGAIAFAESSFFPLPPDVLLIPMVLARRERAWLYAAICTGASVVGGLLGYLIGALLYDSLGQWVISFYGEAAQMAAFREAYAQWGAWIILIKGLTPIPYKIVTIASGFAGYNLGLFIVLSIITRGLRFFIVAGLLRRYGEPIRHFIEGRLELVATAFVVVVVGGFVIARYVI
jgi:membrane protein YqaA with SNARE-associated domain